MSQTGGRPTVGDRLVVAVAGELRRLAAAHHEAAAELSAKGGYWRVDPRAAEHYAAARALAADVDALEQSVRPCASSSSPWPGDGAARASGEQVSD
ncbi:hypothetical protein [Actinopolymorpha pittospori]|uniref:Uncharacterized protein n=1 Tax=Actinopolymorpha pittospori TaxID=648752 RepID=A0A927RG02_9ACTN|nr:hypothetical protein [Actinopolymorpha pittospori]MBE1603766.1 hypothetical protein [Actinopolymorpha pittospori]